MERNGGLQKQLNAFIKSWRTNEMAKVRQDVRLVFNRALFRRIKPQMAAYFLLGIVRYQFERSASEWKITVSNLSVNARMQYVTAMCVGRPMLTLSRISRYVLSSTCKEDLFLICPFLIIPYFEFIQFLMHLFFMIENSNDQHPAAEAIREIFMA